MSFFSHCPWVRHLILVGLFWLPHPMASGQTELQPPDNPIRKKFGGERLELWSLRPIHRPEIPEVNDRVWPCNPIDNFVLSQWESLGLTPEGTLDPSRLMRRLSMDLCGLPPSFVDIENQLASDDPQDVAHYTDKLLGSPDYGKHFGRLWLDVVRYSDSNGFDWDELRKEAWRYRDYVISSWNRDLPFDQFVREQLAGDELLDGAPIDQEQQNQLIATGYLRMGPQDNAASLFNEQDRSRAELMTDLTETTGSAFLGLTLSCCRCHDHKTDPLSHEDHYRFRAFFACVEYGDRLSIDLAEAKKLIELKNAPVQEEIDRLEKEIKSTPKGEKGKREQLGKEKSTLVAQLLPTTPALLMTDSEKQDQPTFLLEQGDHRSPGVRLEPGFPSVLFPQKVTLDSPVNPKTSGRRLTLANWIVSEKNPWTARVIVNRLWQSHFGEGIVSSPNDFGMSGKPPRDPQLLDWLAAELIENEWSLKHIQRLIVTSQVYRQQASKDPLRISLRKQLRRLTAEQLRDAILLTSGQMQSVSGGKPIWPEIPPEILQANPAFLDDNEAKTKGWYPSPQDSQSVRSIYLIQKRTVRLPWLETFDLPENSVSCPQRESSIVPTQALTLLNGDLTLDAANAMATRLESIKDRRQIVKHVFQDLLQRNPNQNEQTISEEYLREHSLSAFCRALMNTNEFMFYE